MPYRIAMDNKLNNTKNCELRFKRDTPPYRVFATWNIHYACNYKCSYCHAPKPEHKDARRIVYIPSQTWIDIWKRQYDKYGTWEILISGGEPFTYPGFMELIFELSKIHIVGICTNLEWDVDYFVKHVGPQRLRIETSFHPEFANLGNFVEKLHALKRGGFNPTVNFVPWPPLLYRMEKIKETIDAAGCQLTLQPFIGQFENRSYPQGYTEEEKEYFKIFKDDCNLKTLDFKTTKESDSTKGKLCRMGQNYVFIHPDGEVSRCCRDHTYSLGNIINGSFNLLEEPVICRAENCNCWRCMLVDKEDTWWRHWGRAEVTDLAMEEHKKKRTERPFKISLIQPPVWGIYEPPVAIAQISSCLKEASYEVSVFDLNIEFYNRRKPEYDTVWAIEQSSFWANEENVRRFFNDNSDMIEEYINKIVGLNPDLIGFSANVCSLPATIELARMIKKRMPGVTTAVGGPMFFIPYDVSGLLKDGCIDIVIRGEGEETFSEVSNFLLEGKDLISCKGIYFQKDGKIVQTEERLPLRNLDELPFLDLENFPLDKYNPPGHLGKHISLMTSRGCVLNCVYCGPKAYWSGFRFMSGGRIYDEVKRHLQRYPEIEHIEFLDLEFNGNMKALNEFCDLMIAQPLKEGLRWHANIIIRPEMNLEVMSKMKKAGCHHLSVGIETGSQRILDLMRKRYGVEDAEMVLKSAHDALIHITTNFMFGFPGETKEDFNLTLDFLRRNARVIGTVYPSRTFCTIEPFSYLAGHMDEFGVIPNPHNNLYWESADGKNNYPERLSRCEEFSRLALELGVSIGLGLQTSLEQDRYYSLGYYYESKKNFKKAIDFFKEYLKLDPKNTVINKKLQELESMDADLSEECRINPITENVPEHKDGQPEYPQQNNGQTSFNWDIHWVCNYRCPYCWFYDQWAQIKSRNRTLPVAELIKAWNNIHTRYGTVKVSITGGEPFLYPNFVEFIKELSQMHGVEIITNLSTDIRQFVEVIDSQNVKVNPSFHPLFATLDKFIERALLLKERGMLQCVSYVSWPPQIPRIDYYTQQFAHHGISISLQSFFGQYQGRRYPDAYTEEEKHIISPQLGDRGGKPFQTEPLKTKGKLCAAGQRYGVIQPDGTVLRCGGINSSKGLSRVGNLFEDGFRLFDHPSPCTFEICPCNEWAFLLSDSEKTSEGK